MDWSILKKRVREKEYYFEINEYLKEQVEIGKIIIPQINKITDIFNMIEFENVKKIIIGQEPYANTYRHKVNNIKIPYATSIAFGIPSDAPETSAIKILKASYLLTNNNKPFDVTLNTYVKEGYFFINKIWSTVLNGRPLIHDEHCGIAWYKFTIDILQFFSEFRPEVPIYFLGKKSYIDNKLYRNNFFYFNHPVFINKIENEEYKNKLIKDLSILWK